MNTAPSRLHSAAAALLIAASPLSTACDAEDELQLEHALDADDDADDALELADAPDDLDDLDLDDPFELNAAPTPQDDPSARVVCALANVSFTPGNTPWQHTTGTHSCVQHLVDLNRSTTDYPAGQWARGDFPQYSGPFSLTDLAKCVNSYIRIERWHRSTVLAPWTQLTTVTQQAGYGPDGHGAYRCRASFTPGVCGNLGEDLQRVIVRPAPNGDLSNPNGATVNHHFQKGVVCY